jgi:sulfiredoxin
MVEDRLKKTRHLPIDEIYVPAKRKKTLEPEKVDTLAESIMEDGQQNPIQVRQGDGRYVLVEGLHRLEACKALGEDTVQAIFVQAQRR